MDKEPKFLTQEEVRGFELEPEGEISGYAILTSPYVAQRTGLKVGDVVWVRARAVHKDHANDYTIGGAVSLNGKMAGMFVTLWSPYGSEDIRLITSPFEQAEVLRKMEEKNV